MRCLALCVLWGVSLSACGSERPSPPPTAPSPTVEPAEADPIPEPVVADPAPEPATASDAPYVSDAELVALGYRIERIDDARSLVCGDQGCACRVPIADPITLERNLGIFRDALANGQGDRTVTCNHGTLGTCGDYRYFLFVGDIYRHEVRWFDASGQMVLRRNVTDYGEFCDGRATIQLMGQIPRCATVAESEVICGETQEVLTPLEDLRALLAGRMPEGSGP